MPTLAGKLWMLSAVGYPGSFRVIPAVRVLGGYTAVGLGVAIVCGTGATAGEYSQAILAGTYVVQIPGVAQFGITVPNGSGTYALEEIDEEESSPLASQAVYADAAAAAAVTISSTVDFVTLRQDSDNPPAYHPLFIRSTHANVLAFTPDGRNVIRDASDARFIRQGVKPDNL